jgi:hypothetical protein
VADGDDPSNENKIFTLGDVFMSNVVSVFDVGTLKMYFAVGT